MMLIAPLIESFLPKTRMWQRHHIHLANFDVAGLRAMCQMEDQPKSAKQSAE